jgi:hypothetical protein
MNRNSPKATRAKLPPAWQRPGGMTRREGGELSFDWEALVPRVVHPLKVSIVEALLWVGRPLSASDLTKLLDDKEFGLSHISYHAVKLGEIGALKVVRMRQVRGATEKFHFFR